jgi:hypothetical protein
MKINCAIIVDSLEKKEECLIKFDNISNITFFTFDNKIKSLDLLKSKKNLFSELDSFFKGDIFCILQPDETIMFWDEEEALKSHYNLIVDKWIIKVRRSNVKNPEVSKIFIRSSFQNVKMFNDDWYNLYSDDSNFLSKLEEYIFINDPMQNELFLIYQYVFEKLKKSKHDKDLVELIRSVIRKYPFFVELINLWGDYLYESHLFVDARTCYENALKMAEFRTIYDFMPMIPRMHKSHPENMLASIEKLILKYDNTI